MFTISAGMILLLFTPFLLSLMGSALMPKMLCLVASLVAALLAVELYAAIIPWAAGMVIAAISVREARDGWPQERKRGGMAPAAPNV
jgi:hypothetical protein